MGRRIDWFLVELERMLGGKVPQSDLEELKNETKSHLEFLANSVAQGESTAAAEQDAIRSFGPPDKIAMNYLRESRGAGGKVLVWLAALSAAFTFGYPTIAFFIGPGWGLFARGPLNLSHWMWLWILLGISFVACCVGLRKRIALPIFAAVTAAFAASMLLTITSVVWVVTDGDGAPVPRFWAANAAREFEQNGENIETQIEKLHRGRFAFSSSAGPQVVPAEFVSNGMFVVPTLSESNANDRFRDIEWSLEGDYWKARQEWTRPLSFGVFQTDREYRAMKATAEAYAADGSKTLSFRWQWALGFWGVAYLGFCVTLIGLQWLILAIRSGMELRHLRRSRLA